MLVIVKKIGKVRYATLSIFLCITGFVTNCYASPTIIRQLFDRNIEPWEAITLITGVLLVLISPKKYRTKLAGIVTAIIVIYFMIIVINIATGLEGLDLRA